MITVKQIKAARALLEISQQDLAQATGLSLTSISAIENRSKMPRMSTLQNIQKAFTQKGIEFTSGNGVRLIDEVFDFQSFVGRKTREQYLETLIDLGKQAKDKTIYSIVQHEYIETPHDRKNLFQFSRQLVKNKIREKLLLPGGVSTLYAPEQTSEYRIWEGDDILRKMSLSIVGSCICFIFGERAVIIENVGLSTAFLSLFLDKWKQAKPIQTKNRLYDQDYEVFTKATKKIR